MRGVYQNRSYCSAAHSAMARVSSMTRRKPISRSLSLYHSDSVCAPPPSPPAPSESAGTPRAIGMLASVEPRRRSVRRPRCRSTERSVSSTGESTGNCAAGRSPIFSIVKVSGPRLRNVFASAFACSTASSTQRCSATSSRSNSLGLVDRKSTDAVALSGIELTLVPPWIVPRFSVVRGSSGSEVSARTASAAARAAIGFGVPASVKLWPPGPQMLI